MKHSARGARAFHLATAMLSLVIGLATAHLDAALCPSLAQSTTPAPFVFSGHTRVRGGDSSFMIGLVQVDLYCSSSGDTLGEKIASARSNYLGVYELAVPRTCEFYNLVAIPPQGHASYMVETAGGKAIHGGWIQYTQPLEGKALGSNEFWMLADFMVMFTPTPSPARTVHPADTPRPIPSVLPNATAGTQATANSSLPILEYTLGLLAACVLILAVRRTIRTRRGRDGST